MGRDFQVDETADLRLATASDRCVACGSTLELTRGIEVGHIFKLGDSYSRAMNATFQDGIGETRYFIMGCYGIGVSRIVAAAIEQNHDDNGIIFPLPIAPFQVIVLNLGLKNSAITGAAAGIYDALRKKKLDVLLDDREERPGVKFKDADLIGIPYRLTVGKRFTQEGLVEIRRRSNGHTLAMPPDKAVDELVNLIGTELGALVNGA